MQLPKAVNPLQYPTVCPADPVWNSCTNPYAFREVDKHALQLVQRHFKDFDELLHKLIFCKDFKNIEKARIIFRWVCSQNIAKVTFEKCNQDSPEHVFNTFKSDSNASFSNIYQLLCCYSGLYCVNVHGYAKNINYLPGDKFCSKAANHTWNAVYIDDRWNLVDIYWSMRYVTCNGPISVKQQFIYECDEFYFLMNPARAIYSHFPLDKRWQLLASPITLEQFENLPLTKSQLFQSGMQMDESRCGVLHCGKNGTRMNFGYSVQAEFALKIFYLKDRALVDQLDGIPTTSFALLETLEDRIIIYIRLPVVGTYYVTIFNKITLSQVDLQSNVFRAACSYKIICDEPSRLTFPPIAYTYPYFGPTWPLMDYYGLNPLSLRNGIYHIGAGTPTVMNITFFKKRNDVCLFATVKMFCRYNQCQTETDRYQNQEASVSIGSASIKTSTDSVTIVVQLPKPAEYFVDIYANDPTDGDNYAHVAQYLLDHSPSLQDMPQAKYDLDVGLMACADGANAKEEGKMKEQEVLVLNEPPPAMPVPSELPLLSVTDADHVVANGSFSPKAPSGFTPKLAEINEGNMQVPLETLPSGNFNYKDRVSTEEQRKNLQLQDDDTLSISMREQDNFVDLIWQLIYSRDLHDDGEKVRAIFYWLCTKNLNKLHFADCQPNSPESILMKITEGKTTYAEVFATLCKYANIQASVVHGYAKGHAYYPGMFLENNNQILHAWNVAMIDGEWHLFDCHWAARRFIGKEPSRESCMYFLDDFYFMPDPNQLKWTHLPFEQKWQLTKDNITVQEFEKLPPVKSIFFKQGLSLASHKEGVISCERSFTLKLNFPHDKAYDLFFTFSLNQETGDASDDLSNYGMHEMISRDPPTVAFNFRFPRTGSYRLLIYVRETVNVTFNTAVEYRVKASVPTNKPPPIPYPPTQQNMYGPADMAFKFGIGCTQEHQAVLSANEGIADIRFFSKTENKLPFLLSQLKGMGQDDDYLSQFVLQRTVKEEGDTCPSNIISAFLPMPGEFAMEVYANNSSEESGQYFLVWQFLLVSNIAYPHGPMPVLPGNVLGCLPEFEKLGLATISHPDPLIRVSVAQIGQEGFPRPECDLSIDILLPESLSSSPDVRVISQLTARSADDETNLTDWVMQMVIGRTLTLMLRFPSFGLYKLHLYAHSLSAIDDTVPVVFTYLIQAPDPLALGGLPYVGSINGAFPKQSNKWKEGAVLMSPLDGQQPCNATVEFSLKIARAKDVVVVMNDVVNHLEGSVIEGTQECVWRGKITLPSTPNSKISVCGRWTAQSSSYPTLLEYQTKSL